MTLERFLQELESHCQTTAIVTFMNSSGEPYVVDLKRDADRIHYGYHSNIKKIFAQKIMSGCNPSGSVILRSFTSEIDVLTKLPYKELRGYILERRGNNLVFEKLSPEMMFACQNTDAETGEPLPLEQAVRYC